MRVIIQWRAFACLHPALAIVALTLVFAVGSLGMSWLADVVYYSRPAPGAMVGATLALYLASAFIVGLCTPLRATTFAPALGHVAIVFLWPLTPWGRYDDLTYESGWAGAVIYTLVAAFIIWLVAYVGWALAAPRKE